MCGVMGCDAAHNFPSWCIRHEGYCTILAAGEKLEPGLEKMWAFEKDLLGIGMLQECVRTGDFDACATRAGRRIRQPTQTPLKCDSEDCDSSNEGAHSASSPAPKSSWVAHTTALSRTSRPGAKVLATDPETGEAAPRKVARLIVTEDDKRFNDLTLTTRNGPEKLAATSERPFWNPSQHRWLPAQPNSHRAPPS